MQFGCSSISGLDGIARSGQQDWLDFWSRASQEVWGQWPGSELLTGFVLANEQTGLLATLACSVYTHTDFAQVWLAANELG